MKYRPRRSYVERRGRGKGKKIRAFDLSQKSEMRCIFGKGLLRRGLIEETRKAMPSAGEKKKGGGRGRYVLSRGRFEECFFAIERRDVSPPGRAMGGEKTRDRTNKKKGGGIRNEPSTREASRSPIRKRSGDFFFLRIKVVSAICAPHRG